MGLKPWEAMIKQKNIDQENILKSIKPLKELFAKETCQQLEQGVEISSEQEKEPKYLFFLKLRKKKRLIIFFLTKLI